MPNPTAIGPSVTLVNGIRFGGGATVTNVLFGSTTSDLGAILDGNEEAVEITVTGAALADFALATHSLDTTDLTVSATVTAADTVTVVVENNTGGTIDLASGTISCLVFNAVDGNGG